MKLFYTVVIIIIILPAVVFTQTIQLRGKVIDVDRKPVKNLSVRFTSFGDAITTSSGEFVITIPKDVQYVDVSLQEENIQILYPVDSKIPVPSDPNFITTLIVSDNKTSGVKNMEESAVKYNELENLLNDIGTTNTELKSILEKFIEIEAERLEISKSKLKEEFELKKKRDEAFSEISPFLDEYILRVKNLKTYFEMFYESAFVSNPSVEIINKSIREYNPVYDTIYYNRNKWQKEISSDWNEVLSANFISSINYMIDEIHAPYIFQLNECMKTINDVRLRTINEDKSPEEMKNEVRSKVSPIMKNLEIKIPILEKRLNEILTRLQHSDLN